MSFNKRSIKKVTQQELNRIKDRKYNVPKSLECECGAIVENVSYDAKSVECWKCVAKQVAPPHNYVSEKDSKKEKKPRGWHFMDEYISPSGKVYHKGELVNESGKSNDAGASGTVSRSTATSKKEHISDSTTIKNITDKRSRRSSKTK